MAALVGACAFFALVPTAGYPETVDGVPVPIAGAGLPGLVAACGPLLALARRRRQLIA
jgi:hypothetical protein